MTLLKGRTILLHEKTQTGVDPFDNPIYTQSNVYVGNVLIEPATNEAVLNEYELNGKHLAYVLHIPKDDTHNWEDTEVEFYGKTWRTYGDCLIYDENLTPLSWNKKVKVERYE